MPQTSARARLTPGADPPQQLPLPEPGWWRMRSVGDWVLQVSIYVIALGVDWVLTTLDGGSLGFQFSTGTVVGLLALMAVTYFPILVRRRWPWQVFALVWTLTTVLDLTGRSQPILGLLVTLHAVAALCSARVAQLALLAAVVPITLQSFWTAHYVSPDQTLTDFLVPFLVFSLLTIAVWLMGRRENHARLDAVALQRQVELTEEAAAARERQRIARELHDILSHSVSAMMMQAAGARAVASGLSRENPDDQRLVTVHQSLTTIEKTGSQSMRELHRLLGVLRDREGEDTGASVLDLGVSEGPPDQPVSLNLLDLVALSRQSGLTVELHDSGEHRVLDPSVTTAAYRVVQESLTNALKHSGRGAVVDIFKVWQADRLQLQVRSRAGHDGTRPGTPSGGTGLFGLRERVELAGGHFESGWVGDEFVTTARLPLTGGSPLDIGTRR